MHNTGEHMHAQFSRDLVMLVSTMIDDPPHRFGPCRCLICAEDCPWPQDTCFYCEMGPWMTSCIGRQLAQHPPGLHHVLMHVFSFILEDPLFTVRGARKEFLLNVLMVEQSPFRRFWGHIIYNGCLYAEVHHEEDTMSRILSFL